MQSAYTPFASLLLTAVAIAAEPAPPRPVMPPDDNAPAASARRLAPTKPANAPTSAPAKPGAGTSKPASPATATTTAATTGSAAAADGQRTGPAPSAIEHDTVILVNEQRFLGTVLASQSDPDWVTINTGTGVLNIPRDRVKRVEFGLTARMGRVKADDLAGLVDLARWCRANARNPQALALLGKAVALPECDLETRGLYAQLVDEIEGADKALPLYLAYRNGGGSAADILARLAELETARTAWEEQMRAMGLNPGASDESGQPVAAATSSAVEEGYEKYKWTPDALDWSSPAKPTLITLVTPEGPRRVMQIDVEPHPSKPEVDKAAIVLRNQLSVRQGSKLTMLVANRGSDDLRLGIAVKTGGEWTYYESKTQVAPATQSGQEFTQLSFDLGASDFKAKSSDWAYSARIAGLDQLRELQILVHNGRKEGSVWIAGITFEGGE